MFLILFNLGDVIVKPRGKYTRLWTVKRIVVDSDILWKEGSGSHLNFFSFEQTIPFIGIPGTMFKWVFGDLEYYVNIMCAQK